MRQNQTGERTEEQWSELYREDPMLYMKEKEDLRDRQARAQAVQQEQYALQQRLLQSEQAKLLERIPEWQNDEVANKERDSIVTYAKRFGFNDQE